MPFKPPTDPEEEYFKREEIAKIRASRKAATHAMADSERDSLKQQHWMRCPKCGMELHEVDFRGVRVDSCFSCGGMYFDAGEVTKILEYEEPGFLDKIVGSLIGPRSS